MVICSLNHKYSVVRVLEEDSKSITYGCIDYAEKNGKRYRIVLLKNIKRKLDLLDYFNEVLSRDDFHDLVDCFQSKDNFYVVFLYETGMLLKDRLENEKYDLPERMQIGRALIGEIVIQNMPCYFLCKGLEKNRVIMNNSLKVKFQYGLKDVESHKDYTMSDVCKCVDNWMVRLFPKEIKKQISLELKAFRRALKKGEFQNYMDLYTEYLNVYNSLEELYESGEYKESKTLLSRGINVVTTFLNKYSTFLGIIVLLFIAAFVVWLICRKEYQKQQPREAFQYIGNVKIGEDIE